MSIRAILFDFDGTLADSFDAITASVNHVRALHRLPLLSMTQVKPYVGFGLPHLLEQLIPGGNVVDCVAAYRQHHRTVFLEMTRLYSDVQATLVRLHQSGYKMAVCSNKLATFTRPLLQALGVGECFPVVLGPDDVPQPKPAPDMLIAALRAIGASSNEAVYVGDMSVPVARSSQITSPRPVARVIWPTAGFACKCCEFVKQLLFALLTARSNARTPDLAQRVAHAFHPGMSRLHEATQSCRASCR
jgi:phosphoglycolate phosphatase